MILTKLHLSLINVLVALSAVGVYGSNSPVLLKAGFIFLYFISLWSMINFKQIKIVPQKEEMAEFDLTEEEGKNNG